MLVTGTEAHLLYNSLWLHILQKKDLKLLLPCENTTNLWYIEEPDEALSN